jgi:mannose-6-phosphate isomerase-like protein (cupin superfamily)
MREPLIKRPQNLPLIAAADGALVSEFFGRTDGIRNLGVAAGSLVKRREAVPHYHARCDEIYIVLSGSGLVQLGSRSYALKRGDQVFIPRGLVHALINSSHRALKILCVSAPAFSPNDFLLAANQQVEPPHVKNIRDCTGRHP